MCVDENAKFPRQYQLATAFCMIYSECQLTGSYATPQGFESYLHTEIEPRSKQFTTDYVKKGDKTVSELRSIVLGSTSVEHMLRFKLAQEFVNLLEAKISISTLYSHPIVKATLPTFISSVSSAEWTTTVAEIIAMAKKLKPQDIPENNYLKWVDEFTVAAYNTLERARAANRYFEEQRRLAASQATKKVHTGRMVSKANFQKQCADQDLASGKQHHFARLSDAATKSDQTYDILINDARKKLAKLQ